MPFNQSSFLDSLLTRVSGEGAAWRGVADTRKAAAYGRCDVITPESAYLSSGGTRYRGFQMARSSNFLLSDIVHYENS